MEVVAKRIRALRESAGLSQAKIAAMNKLTQASVNRYENAQASPPLEVLLWYADFFDVSLDYIFGRTEAPEGRLYDHKPNLVEAMTQEDKKLRQFVDMCFDPASPISEKLREILTEQLKENSQ